MVVAFGRWQGQPPGRTPSAFHFTLVSCFFSSDFPQKSPCKKQSSVVSKIQRLTQLWNPTLAHKTRKDGAPGQRPTTDLLTTGDRRLKFWQHNPLLRLVLA